MTRRERAKSDAPATVDVNCVGGVSGCPADIWGVGHPQEKDDLCKQYHSCSDCWDAEWTRPKTKTEKNDQKLKRDAGKPRVSLVPLKKTLENTASVFEFGLSKGYKEGSWRDVEVQRYLDSFGRHYGEFHDNPRGVDEESGLPILFHLSWHIFVLNELIGE